MYTLRSFEDGIESNQSIGNNYQVINRKVNYEKFCEAFAKTWGKNHVADLDDESDKYTKNTYAFLVVDGGSKLIPLYKGMLYYIVSENGKTFDNLTRR